MPRVETYADSNLGISQLGSTEWIEASGELLGTLTGTIAKKFIIDPKVLHIRLTEDDSYQDRSFAIYHLLRVLAEARTNSRLRVIRRETDNGDILVFASDTLGHLGRIKHEKTEVVKYANEVLNIFGWEKI